MPTSPIIARMKLEVSPSDFVFPSSSTGGRGKALSESNIRDITSKIVNRNYKLSVSDFELSYNISDSTDEDENNTISISSGIAVIRGYRIVLSESKTVILPSALTDTNNSSDRAYRVYLTLHTQSSTDGSITIDSIGSGNTIGRYLGLSFEEFTESSKYSTVSFDDYHCGIYTRDTEPNIQKIDSKNMVESTKTVGGVLISGEMDDTNDRSILTRSRTTASEDISTLIPKFDETLIDNMTSIDSNSSKNEYFSLLLGYIYMSSGSIVSVETENNSIRYIDADRIYYGGLKVDEYLLSTGSFVGAVGESIISSKINISNQTITSTSGTSSMARSVEKITKEASPRIILSSIDNKFYKDSESGVAIPYYSNYISIGEGSEELSDNISEISTFYKESDYDEYVAGTSINDLLLEVRSIKNTTGYNLCRSEYFYSNSGDTYRGYLDLGSAGEFRIGMYSARQADSYVEGVCGYLSIGDIETALTHAATVRMKLLTDYQSFVGHGGEFYYTDELAGDYYHEFEETILVDSSGVTSISAQLSASEDIIVESAVVRYGSDEVRFNYNGSLRDDGTGVFVGADGALGVDGHLVIYGMSTITNNLIVSYNAGRRFYNRAGFGTVSRLHRGIILEAVDNNGNRVYRYPSYDTGEVIPDSELETDPITEEVTTERGCIYLDGYLRDSSDENKFRPNIRMNGHLKVDHYIRAKRVYNAVYNDYAEWYNSKIASTIEPGDVIYYNEENDDYRNISDKPELVVGICTDNYGIIVGGEELGDMEMNRRTHVPVSLCGRVNVKIKSNESVCPGCILYADGSNVASTTKSDGCKIGKVIKINQDNTALVQVSM